MSVFSRVCELRPAVGGRGMDVFSRRVRIRSASPAPPEKRRAAAASASSVGGPPRCCSSVRAQGPRTAQHRQHIKPPSSIPTTLPPASPHTPFRKAHREPDTGATGEHTWSPYLNSRVLSLLVFSTRRNHNNHNQVQQAEAKTHWSWIPPPARRRRGRRRKQQQRARSTGPPRRRPPQQLAAMGSFRSSSSRLRPSTPSRSTRSCCSPT